MVSTPTFTQSGAERALRQRKDREVIRLQMKATKVERGLQRDLERIYTTPVTDGLHGMTWQAAEIMARDWMKKNGHWGAKLTKAGADGGIDIESMTSIAQVKHHASRVGIAEMQRLYGIAQSTRKKALFFAASGYSDQALKWATKHKIECYVYPPIRRVKA
ncbi:restriction endonuclease [Rhodococcus sp. NPDC004095]